MKKTIKITIEITIKRAVMSRVLRILDAKEYKHNGYAVTSINYDNSISMMGAVSTTIFEAVKIGDEIR